MLHEPHSTVFGPTFFIIVSYDIFVIRIRILRQESLNKLSRLIRSKLENDVNMINISHVHSDRMTRLNFYGLKEHELILILRGSSQLGSPIQPQYKQINNKPIKLENKRHKLQAHNGPKEVGMIHILKRDRNIILRRHIIRNIMIHDKPQQPIQQGKINLLINFIQPGLQQDHRLPLPSLPDPMQVVNPLAVLVQ